MSVGEPVLRVFEMDGIPIVFTGSSIWTIPGSGPDAAGEGFFDTPRRIHPSGTISAGSVVECPLGIFFQGQDRQLQLLRRGALAVEPAASGMRSFSGRVDSAFLPDDALVTSALYVPAESRVLFSVSSTNTRRRLIAYDLLNGQLYDDDATGTVTDGAYVGSALDSDYPLILANGKPMGTYLDEFVQRRTEGAASWWLGPVYGGSPRARPLVFSTSSLTPWGPSGWGRVREAVFSTERIGAGAPSVAVYSRASGNLGTTDLSVGEDNRTIRVIPVTQKCSTMDALVVDSSSPPMVWNGVFLDTTSTGRSRL